MPPSRVINQEALLGKEKANIEHRTVERPTSNFQSNIEPREKRTERMTPTVYQEELRTKQVAAFWAGDVGTEGDLTEYFGTPFERDFGFLLDYEELPEFTRIFTEPRLHAHYNRPFVKSDIGQLLATFSLSKELVKEVERLCRDKGIHEAKTVVVFLSLQYREELCRNLDAPLRFIGNVDWPEGVEHWARLQSKRLLMPPFPKLIRRDFGEEGDGLFMWEGIVRLESWKGFATGTELSNGEWTPTKGCRPEGDYLLQVDPVSPSEQSPPTLEQTRAFELLVTNQFALREAMLEGLFKVYPEWRQGYLGTKWSDDGGKTWRTGFECPGMFPPENMPEVRQPRELPKLIRPGGPLILKAVNDGIADIRIGFNCKWDEEHGFAVLIHRGKEIEVGDSDLGI